MLLAFNVNDICLITFHLVVAVERVESGEFGPGVNEDSFVTPARQRMEAAGSTDPRRSRQ